MILDAAVGRPAQRRARRAVAEPARWLGVDLVAAGDLRDPVAGEQDDIEDGRGEADQALDPAPESELRRGAMRHGARL
jgi:hypothetical protein